MQYIKMEHLQSGMVLAKSIIGDNGSVLLSASKEITPTILTRMNDMGFQGAYVANQVFDDIVVDDIIDTDLSLQAFSALATNNIDQAASIAKKIVQELRYKDVVNVDLLDIKSDKNYIFKHSISVCIFSVVIAMGMQLPLESIDHLAVAGMLHDIGKLKINENVLYSRNKFSRTDMKEMERHPIISYELLKDRTLVSSMSRNAILFHHENIDGSGYYHSQADQIGLLPRILRVADVYDSMTALKAYRKASSPQEAIEYIMANSGVLFDPEVVNVFAKKFPLYPVGFTILLSNKSIAVVTSNKENSMRPQVRLANGSNINLATDPNYRSTMIVGMI